ncbi:hypothetical protein GCM10018954_089380 [Kutzneria kofuensis]
MANATQTATVDGPAADAVRHEFDAKARSQTSIIFGRFVRHRLAMASLGVLILLAIASFVVPLFLKYNYSDTSAGGYLRPGGGHLLGTDQLGRTRSRSCCAAPSSRWPSRSRWRSARPSSACSSAPSPAISRASSTTP